MKIVFDQQVFLLQKYGGISRYICSLAQSLSGIPDVNVKVIAPLHHNYYLRKPLMKKIAWGIWVPSVNRTHRFVNYLSKLVADLFIRVLSPQVVHETYFSSIGSACLGEKRVVTVYDMIHEKFPDSFLNSHLTTELKRQTFKRADHIICISENTRKDLIDIFDIEEKKTSVVYLGCDFLEPKASVNPKFELVVTTKPYLLFVGSRGGYKNAEKLITAYAQSEYLSKNYLLVFFGGGSFNDNENSHVSNLGLDEEKIIQIDGDDGDLAYMYKMAAVFVYPSLYEGFGIPPLEAMSLACPVACSNTSSIPEVVGDAAELFSPDNTDEIIHSIMNIVSSNERKVDLVRKGLERCKLFSWDRCAKETHNIYKELL